MALERAVQVEDNIERISVTLTDTIPANADIASGVDIATLTDNVITASSQIKGMSIFNKASTSVDVLYYNNKLILHVFSTVAQARTFSIPMIIYYTK